MEKQYANRQPPGFDNHVQNVAVVGAGGQIGRHIVQALLFQGKHNVTALTRIDSTSKLPEGLHHIQKADYSDHTSLIEVLRGQEVLIITMNVGAAPDSQKRLIDAAVEAGVRYIMPNEYGIPKSGTLGDDTLLGPRLRGIQEYIESKSQGKTIWISLSCSFWYEYSLAGSEARYGFDVPNKRLTLFDDGTTNLCTSTWPQAGRAVARLFALPIFPQDENDMSPSISDWHNETVLVNSFTLNQRDMLASILRVTGDKEEDWTITRENTKERYERGMAMMKGGNITGFAILLYTRAFYPSADADFSDRLDNEKLGLAKEDLDQWTKVAVEMAVEGEVGALEGRTCSGFIDQE